jgi:hypothetical protein
MKHQTHICEQAAKTSTSLHYPQILPRVEHLCDRPVLSNALKIMTDAMHQFQNLGSPTRLLYITTQNRYIRLVERSERNVWKQPYATLSHNCLFTMRHSLQASNALDANWSTPYGILRSTNYRVKTFTVVEPRVINTSFVRRWTLPASIETSGVGTVPSQ